MTASSIHGDHELSSSQTTLVLVGRKGNGKSATGNKILGTNVFRSSRSSSGVTTTCEMHSTKLEDGQMINVIDTPGICGSYVDADFTVKEIINCIDMAGDGIHAFLVVFSIRNRFSKDEEAVIMSLLKLFGSKVYDYMILVFTGGDVLDKDDETLEDFLHDCPEKLKEILNLCENRCVLFDNKTDDQTKRSDQVKNLLSCVNMVSRKNGGRLYNIEMFDEWKKEAEELEKEAEILQAFEAHKRFTEQEISKQILEMVESKQKETTLRLEKQLAEEQAARLKAEQDAEATQKMADEEIRHIKQQIEKAKRKQKGVSILDEIKSGICVIM